MMAVLLDQNRTNRTKKPKTQHDSVGEIEGKVLRESQRVVICSCALKQSKKKKRNQILNICLKKKKKKEKMYKMKLIWFKVFCLYRPWKCSLEGSKIKAIIRQTWPQNNLLAGRVVLNVNFNQVDFQWILL